MITSSKCRPRNSTGRFLVTLHRTRSAQPYLQQNRVALHPPSVAVESPLRLFATEPEILTGCEDSPFSRYLEGREPNLALGQMFKIIGFAQRPASRVMAAFADWLKGEHPVLLAALSGLRTDKIVTFRNREDHPDVRLIGRHEADETNQICRDVITILYPR